MNVTIAVLLAVLALGGLLLVLGALRSSRRSQPETAEHWLVERAGNRPRLQRTIAQLDRRVFGGAALAVSVIVVGVAGVLVGLTFDTLDTNRGFARWDEAVAEWGADNATSTSTDVLNAITHLGGSLYLLPLLGIVGAVDVLRRRRWEVFGFLATTGIGIVVVNNALKLIVGRDRPSVEHLVGSSGSSFPSGHSAAAAACWAALALVASQRLGARYRPFITATAAAIAIAVAASRALLGVHWLTDVIAGVIVGWAWFALAAIVFGGRIVRLGEPGVELGAEANDDSSTLEHDAANWETIS